MLADRRLSLVSRILGAALTLCGCDTVATKYRLEPLAGPEEMEKFEGFWIAEKGAFYVAIGDDGVVQLAFVVWEGQKIQLQHGELTIVEGGYLLCRIMEDGEWSDYLVLEYAFLSEDEIVVWGPNVASFKQAVDEKRLQGEVIYDFGTEVTLTDTPEKVLEFMKGLDGFGPFLYKEPTLLTKHPLEDFPDGPRRPVPASPPPTVPKR